MFRDPTARSRSRSAAAVAAGAAGVLVLAGGCAFPEMGESAGTSHRTILAAAFAEGPIFDDPLTQREIEDIQWLTAILNNPANDADTRSGAAERLVSMGRAEALAPLNDALRSRDAGLMLAVLAGLAEPPPAPELLPALVEALKQPPEAVLDPLILAIGRFGDPALEAVGSVASDRDLDDARRLGAIHALGTFRSRATAIQLMAFLDERRDESDAVIEAVCAALRRSTGLHYGSDPDAWRRWWGEARDLPQEQWLTNLVQRLDEQLAEAQQQIQRERERGAALERRISETYRDLLPITMQLEDQFRLLPALMEDRLASLRTFAIDRIARLLRDSVRIPEELQQRMVDMLADDVPAIRLQVARLVDQLNVEGAAERIAQRLATESSTEVATAFMDILTRRPAPAALEPARIWMTDATLGDRAANMAWEVVRTREIDPAAIEQLRETLRTADRWRTSPEHARLAAAIAKRELAQEMERLLDDDDPLLRRAVAEGFLASGSRRPLLDRAHDEVIYPFAVRSLSRDPVDLATMRTALAMTPATETGRAVWAETLVKIAGKLPPQSLREVDDMLDALMNDQFGSAAVTPQLRASILSRARTLAADALDADVRVELLTRLARQLLLLDQSQQAHEVMETVNGQALTEAARDVKFEAAVRSGHHEIAAQIEPAPEPWVALLAQLAERDDPAALLLSDEIRRRFDEQLAGEVREQFERLSDRLSRQRAEAAAGPST